jgi:purine nucleoside phosphorylase
MRILVNENNQIVGYSVAGSLEDDFEVSDEIVPNDFIQNYKSKYYLYQNEQIVVNPNYETETSTQPITPTPTQPEMSDETLKNMVATLQKQSVQSNMKINKLLKDNQDLKNKVSELENKEVEANE